MRCLSSLERLPFYALFAGLLAAAGLPIYIHAPKFYVDEFGVSLAALGFVLFGLRFLDVVQDPFFGWLSARFSRYRSGLVGFALCLMAVAMIGLFAVAPPLHPLAWFAFMLTLVFSAFSFLTINFYAQGVSKANQLRTGRHLRVARWRETGALLGICLAAVAPEVLSSFFSEPFAAFAILFAFLAICALFLMRNEWVGSRLSNTAELRVVLQDPLARRLLCLALLNAAPVAVTSTLFLFFVESRLQSPESSGLLLLLFFLSAAVAAPIWGKAAERFGEKPVLLAAMLAAIAVFGFAMTLRAGDISFFVLVCVGSGAAIGADLTLLPAMFASRMAQIAPTAAEGFGLWSFVSKFTLAFAAVTLLPVLDYSGFQSGTENSEGSLQLLSALYAGLPCALKLCAFVLLFRTKI